jgi:ADP-ribosyl-[dinitrogen reductase] hydrolase
MWKRTVTGAAHGSAAANETATVGSLLGTAVGDAIGLPYEGLSARRRGRLFRESGRHHLLAGRGMVSDDTEHACFTAQALITSGGDLHRFRRRLARSLRWWLLGLPAGVGLATARAILKLWVGVPPTRSGVYSAGNGPAMRAPILGVALGADPERLKAFVGASTALTHSDPRAHAAALAVALAAHLGASGRLSDAASYRQALAGLLSDAAATFARLDRAAGPGAGPWHCSPGLLLAGSVGPQRRVPGGGPGAWAATAAAALLNRLRRLRGVRLQRRAVLRYRRTSG